MILYSNLPKLIARAKACDSVIDVGGWHNPFGPATHVIDLGSHATRQAADSLTPGEVERFSAETWTIHDVCTPPWPFEDNRFDFAICSHLLEDVRDPIAVCRELARVAKARFFTLRAALGRMPEIGFYHHRWMVEGEGSALRFFRKSHQLAMDSDFFITRGELGRKMTENESGRCLWWEGDFTAEEVYEVEDEDLRAFKRQALARLKRG